MCEIFLVLIVLTLTLYMVFRSMSRVPIFLLASFPRLVELICFLQVPLINLEY